MTEARRPRAWAWLVLAWLLVVGALAWQQAGFWREGRLDSDVLALLPGAHEDPRLRERLAHGLEQFRGELLAVHAEADRSRMVGAGLALVAGRCQPVRAAQPDHPVPGYHYLAG